MRLLQSVLSAAALWVSTAYGSLSQYSPLAGITYTVGIPSSTVSSGSGDIYVQLQAPSTYTWVGLGIGEAMDGATMFIMYAAGDGNVTISPRIGGNHVMPLFNSEAQVTLLAGSGVANGVMTANVKYVAASGLLSLSSTSSDWICSWKSGSPLDSTSQSATIYQHDAHSQFAYDLTQAVVSADSNPFVGPGSTNTTSSAHTIADPTTIYKMSHGIIMASCMVVLLPVGAIIIRVGGGIWLHAAVQLFTLAALFSGLGLGIHLAQLTGYLFNTTHTLLGTSVVCLLIIQPFLGYFHHLQYRKIGRRSYFGLSHIWYGRILITLGVINGGLGLQLANNSMSGELAYGIVAGAMFVIYLVVVVVTAIMKRRKQKRGAVMSPRGELEAGV